MFNRFNKKIREIARKKVKKTIKKHNKTKYKKAFVINY